MTAKGESEISKAQDQQLLIPDITEILLNANTSAFHRPYLSPGRGINRPSSGHRERRRSGVGDEDKWNKTRGPPIPRQEFQPHLSYGGNPMRFRLVL